MLLYFILMEKMFEFGFMAKKRMNVVSVLLSREINMQGLPPPRLFRHTLCRSHYSVEQGSIRELRGKITVCCWTGLMGVTV